MSENDEILRRLKALEEENLRLKKQLQTTETPIEVKPTTTHVTLWKGHPVIRFEGPFRPFSLGLRKASVVLEKIDDVRFFVENNQQHLAAASDHDDHE